MAGFPSTTETRIRIIVPYTTISPGCNESLRRHCPDAERHYVGGDVLDYWRVMCQAWADGEDFILIEHDVIFDASHIDGLTSCERDWCTAADYFQMTLFRSGLMRAVPHAFTSIPVPLRHWLWLDGGFRAQVGAAGLSGSHYHFKPQQRAENGRENAVCDYRVMDWGRWARALPDADWAGVEWLQTWAGKQRLIPYDGPCDRDYCKQGLRGHSGNNRCHNCPDVVYDTKPPYRAIGWR